MITTAKNLLETISFSTSPFHTTAFAKQKLNAAGFLELDWCGDWNIIPEGNYYISPFGTTLFAFTVGKNISCKSPVKIASSHIDNPGLRIKANPEFSQGSYKKVNTEVYGGAIYNTWLDRPLSIAGRVFTKRPDSPYIPDSKLIDFKRPVLLIPNISIHLNRTVNEGIPLNPQIDLIPIAGLYSDKNTDSDNHFIQELIAEELKIPYSDILNYELCIYNCERGCTAGIKDEFIMAPRIDNISSVQACLRAITESNCSDGVNLIALFDHEEVGSRSSNGAAGNLLPYVLERIYSSLGFSRNEYIQALMSGFALSLDVAHATNPNHPEKYDITSKMNINDGIAIKSTSKLNYCGDGESAAMITSFAAMHNIPAKINYLRSDTPGGSTLGSILSSVLPMKCADIGAPIFSMHSAMETIGILDQYYLEKLVQLYFSEFLN